MRKAFLSLLFAVLWAGSAFAAGSSCTVSADDIFFSKALNRPVARVITIAFVADSADGTIPTLALNASTTGLKHGAPFGWFGHAVSIDCNHAGTEPTENSELYIYDAYGGDMLGGQGVDQVDNTAERRVYFHNGTAPVRQPCVDAWTVTITQQAAATNSATGTIKIILTAGE